MSANNSNNGLTIAVTGLNATDNPGPGMTVIRAIRNYSQEPRRNKTRMREGRGARLARSEEGAYPVVRNRRATPAGGMNRPSQRASCDGAATSFEGRIVGLAYDTLDPGIYARDMVDDVFLIPYPSQGPEALEARLRYIHEQVGGLDVILPTLDSELASFIELAPVLEGLGIGTFLPSKEQLDMRSKINLTELGRRADIKVPASRVIHSVRDLYSIHEEVPFPLLVKGVYYGAELARSPDEAVAAFHRVVAKWGLPVIVQTFVAGDELDVVAVGDGEGGLVGAVPMKKTYITDKGKGWAGITIKDPQLIALTRRFVAATNWRGPCEVEVIKDRSGGYHLLEVNPRFPAWSYLSAGAGMNLPLAVVRLAAGREVLPMEEYRVGTMFVRISVDQIASLDEFQAITQTGELLSALGMIKGAA